MGTKAGMLVTAVGIAMMINAHRKKSAAQSQAAPQSGGHNYGAAALGVAGVGAAGYAAHHALSGSGNHTAPQATGPMLRDSSIIYHHLVEGVLDQKIQPFYNAQQLQQIADRLAQTGALDQIAQTWQLPPQFALDLVRLALFDVVLLVDDSTSMKAGNRLQEMQTIVGEIAYCCGNLDFDGIEIRFMNSQDGGNNVRNPQDVAAVLGRNPPNGRTPLGKSMRDKILRPLVIDRARQGALRKPVLVLTLTDGAANDHQSDAIDLVIDQAKKELSKTRYTDNAISFAFAQVGDDKSAIEFLSALDDNRVIGDMIDVTSNTEHETKEILKAMDKKSGNLPPEWKNMKDSVKKDRQIWDTLFRMKRLVGGVHSWYDASDEKKASKRSSWLGSSDPVYRPHWSEQKDFQSRSEALHSQQGYPPYRPMQNTGYGQPAGYGSRDASTPASAQSFGSPAPPSAPQGYPSAPDNYSQQYNAPQGNYSNSGYQQQPMQGGFPQQSMQGGCPQQPMQGGFQQQYPAQGFGAPQEQFSYQQQQQQQYGYNAPPQNQYYQQPQGGFQQPGQQPQGPGGFGFPQPQY